MAVKTATKSGLWSDTTVWGGTLPVSGDSVVVNTFDVEFDVDQSGMASGITTLSGTGTLHASLTAGTYYLKATGAISIAHLLVGTSRAVPYPATCDLTLFYNAASGSFITSADAQTYCQDSPTHFFCKLSQAESLGATTLHVDTDLTGAGDTGYWKANALVRIDNINQAVQTEERTISSLSVSTLVITVGLTAAKAQGAYISIITRNVRILSSSASGGNGFAAGTGSVCDAEVRVWGNGTTLGTSWRVGGTFSNCGFQAINQGTAHQISALISGSGQGINAGTAFIITSPLISAVQGIASGVTGIIRGTIFSGNSSCLSSCLGFTLINVSLINSTTGVSSGSGHLLLSCTLNNNTRDLNASNGLNRTQLFACLLGSATEFLNYNSVFRTLIDYVESLDHDQVAGAFRAWTTGGITSSVSSPVYDASRVRSYNAVCESATTYAFWQRQVLVPALGTVYVRCYVQKDVSMSYLPRVQIFASSKEPLISGSADATAIMTNSTNTWEVLEVSFTNSTNAPVPYTVRMLAQNASGNVYFDPIIRTSNFVYPQGISG